MPHTGKLQYHIVWVTKYRRPVLTDLVQLRLKELIKEVCISNDFELIEIETMDNHVHCFISANSKVSVNKIANALKGFTSRYLRKEFNSLTTRLPTLWTRSYYAGTIGTVSEETIKRYIQNQKRS